jgi:hypothetical protein
MFDCSCKIRIYFKKVEIFLELRMARDIFNSLNVNA